MDASKNTALATAAITAAESKKAPKSDEAKKQDSAAKRVKTLIAGLATVKEAALAMRTAGKTWIEVEASLKNGEKPAPAVTPVVEAPKPAEKPVAATAPTTPAKNAQKAQDATPASPKAQEAPPATATPQALPAAPKAPKAEKPAGKKPKPTTPAEAEVEKVEQGDAIRAALASSKVGDVLGFLVWSSINPKIIIDRTEFVKLVEAEGLSDIAPSPELRDRSAFRKALHAAEDQGLVRKIREDADMAVYALVSEAMDEEHDKVDYAQEETAYYNKKEKTFELQAGKYGAKIKEAFDKFLSVYNHDDVRAWVLRSFRDGFGAIVVRDHGGVYFLPAQFKDILERMDRVMQAVDAGSGLSIVGLQKTGREQKDIGRVAVAQLRTQIGGMVERLGEVLESDARKSTFETRLGDFKAFREQLTTYKDILSFQAADIEKAIADAEKKLKIKIATF